MKRIAIATAKGGVGKTTMVVSLGAGLAEFSRHKDTATLRHYIDHTKDYQKIITDLVG